MDDLNYNVAVNLKRIRREKGMSLERMAEQTGVSKSMLAQIEKGIADHIHRRSFPARTDRPSDPEASSYLH